MPLPRTRYAHSGELSIAYQVVGSGPPDLVMAPGFVSHLEWGWQEPGVRHFLERLASFTRLLLFDKRGTGLSDPVPGPGTLEERIDDVRAVMDAAGSGRAALFGTSEGGAMVMLFAALHPERISSLILYGTAARWTRAADYPYGRPVGPYLDALDSYVDRSGEGVALDVFAPSRADDPGLQEWWAAMQRMGASPGMARQLFSTYAHLDVRDILGAIHVPTLVMHRRGDRVMDPAHGRYLAEHIPGARWVELDGEDHLPFVGDAEQVVAEIEEFLTGSRPPPAAVDRVLATVLFVDVAGSTALAARVGDAAWASMRARFLAAVRHELPRYSGTEVDAAGDGIFATFTGPARAIRCAVGIREAAGAIGLSVRTGVHAGEVELEEGGGVSGLAVHIGARVMAEAEPGEVLVTGTVKDLVVGSGLRFTERGTRTLRGVPGSWPVFAVDA